MTYEEFVKAKSRRFHSSAIDHAGLQSYGLFDFQDHVTRNALDRGRYCIFAGTGLGKTRMQVAFANEAAKYGPVLILAPIAVADQTIDEARVMGVDIHKLRDGSLPKSGVSITNYHRLENIEGSPSCIVLDESSILKSHDGHYRKYLTDRFAQTPHKLCLTATPAPNDYTELATHAEFVGACSRMEMLAEYFTHDGGDTSKWRLKRHAVKDFWTWVQTWAACFDSPESIGFNGDAYILPPLNVHEHPVGDADGIGGLFGGGDTTNATTLYSGKRKTMADRVSAVREIADTSKPLIIWCVTNQEQDAIEKLFPGALSVRGSDSIDVKEDRLTAFGRGDVNVLITKTSIAGFGLNWQHCDQMIFSSMTFSFEQYYQAVRRCYRFGQKSPVHVHIVYDYSEASIQDVIARKSLAFESLTNEMANFREAS
jgi:superfamily II DNA or RNA helicase